MDIPTTPIAPPGAVAKVTIVDSTATLKGLSVPYLMGPPMPGFDTMQDMPCWVFLIESSTGQKALFDLGIRKDWRNLPPVIVDKVEKAGWTLDIPKNTIEVLQDHGMKAEEIGSIIWSHWHFDHLGDASIFPPTTELVVGPGFTAAQIPGYPTNPTANVLESDFADRPLRELPLTPQSFPLTIANFPAHDFFGDGSFYLLSTPGHAVGHLSGLARTTTTTTNTVSQTSPDGAAAAAADDTFIFMAGDLCHHSGEMRPSRYLALPNDLPPLCSDGGGAGGASPPGICPGGALQRLYDSRERVETQAFFRPAMGLDVEEATRTIWKAQEGDARREVLFVYAHDGEVGVVTGLGKGEGKGGKGGMVVANDWREKGWGEKMRWGFLRDLWGGGGGEVRVGWKVKEREREGGGEVKGRWRGGKGEGVDR